VLARDYSICMEGGLGLRFRGLGLGLGLSGGFAFASRIYCTTLPNLSVKEFRFRMWGFRLGVGLGVGVETWV